MAVLKVKPMATLGSYAEGWIERRKPTIKPGTLTAYRGMLLESRKASRR